MRTHGVVVPSPGLDHNLGLVERVEDLPVEQLVTQFSVEGFAIAILSGTARLDIGGLGSNGRNPFPKCRCHELGAVIGTDVRWNPAQYEEVGENIDDVRSFELAGHPNSEALARELVDHAQHAEGSTIVGAIADKVIGPHVIGTLGPKPYA
jgi:hypothetical protein